MSNQEVTDLLMNPVMSTTAFSQSTRDVLEAG